MTIVTGIDSLFPPVVINPVTVVCWLDPPTQMDRELGSAVNWHMAFEDSILKTPVDPDIVIFQYDQPPVSDTPVVFVYPNPSIVKNSVGNYQLSILLDIAGKWLLTGIAEQNPGVGVGQNTTSINVYPTGQ